MKSSRAATRRKDVLVEMPRSNCTELQNIPIFEMFRSDGFWNDITCYHRTYCSGLNGQFGNVMCVQCLPHCRHHFRIQNVRWCALHLKCIRLINSVAHLILRQPLVSEILRSSTWHRSIVIMWPSMQHTIEIICQFFAVRNYAIINFGCRMASCCRNRSNVVN